MGEGWKGELTGRWRGITTMMEWDAAVWPVGIKRELDVGAE